MGGEHLTDEERVTRLEAKADRVDAKMGEVLERVLSSTRWAQKLARLTPDQLAFVEATVDQMLAAEEGRREGP